MIRPFRDEDAPAAVALLRAEAVDWCSSPASLLHRLACLPPRAHPAAWVVEEDGEIVGVGRARLRWEVSEAVVGWLWIDVRTDARNRGVGDALHEAAARHLAAAGARSIESFAHGEPGQCFLEAHGYRRTGTEYLSRLDVASADTSALDGLRAAKAEEGFRVVPLAEALDRRRELHAVYAAALADVPAGFEADDLRYDEWARERFADPDLSGEVSAVVLHEDVPAALAFVMADGEGLAANDLTGTLPAFRRRGLARLVKLASIRAAAAAGVERIITGSDEENEAMRALNASLGYRPAATLATYLREDR